MCPKHLVKMPTVNLTRAVKNHMYETFLMLLLL